VEQLFPGATLDRLRGYSWLELVYERTFPNATVTIFKIRPGERAR
jgi:hypothetical protein